LAVSDNIDNLLGLVNEVDPSWGKAVNAIATPEVIKLFSTPSLITAGSPGLAFLQAWGLGVTIGQAAQHLSTGAPTTADKAALNGYASLGAEFATANDVFGFAFLSGLSVAGAYAPISDFLTDAETSFPGLAGVLTSLNADANSFTTSFTNDPNAQTALVTVTSKVLTQPGF